MDIKEVVRSLNDACGEFAFGELQQIRKEHLQLKRRPSQMPFGWQATFPEGAYAYHVGGQGELQFNLGIEGEDLRWGVAISLHPSQAFPNPIQQLSPKVDRLNEFIRRQPHTFGVFGRGTRSRSIIDRWLSDADWCKASRPNRRTASPMAEKPHRRRRSTSSQVEAALIA